jgi:cysteine dioxygenase
MTITSAYAAPLDLSPHDLIAVPTVQRSAMASLPQPSNRETSPPELAEKMPIPHDSGRNSPAPANDFQALVAEINHILGRSGISSAGINVQDLKVIMSTYHSREADWKRYAFADPTRGYTRNLVDAGNGQANLLILVWTPGKGSPIHDHANAHCVMKILKGELKESLYRWPCQSVSHNAPLSCATAADSVYPSTLHSCSTTPGSLEPHALRHQRATTYTANEVTYMSDKLGLHRIENPSASEVAVSLHLYTPPNAAKSGCRIFEESTGRSSRVAQCHFYSEFGVKM